MRTFCQVAKSLTFAFFRKRAQLLRTSVKQGSCNALPGALQQNLTAQSYYAYHKK